MRGEVISVVNTFATAGLKIAKMLKNKTVTLSSLKSCMTFESSRKKRII